MRQTRLNDVRTHMHTQDSHRYLRQQLAKKIGLVTYLPKKLNTQAFRAPVPENIFFFIKRKKTTCTTHCGGSGNHYGTFGENHRHVAFPNAVFKATGNGNRQKYKKCSCRNSAHSRLNGLLGERSSRESRIQTPQDANNYTPTCTLIPDTSPPNSSKIQPYLPLVNSRTNNSQPTNTDHNILQRIHETWMVFREPVPPPLILSK